MEKIDFINQTDVKLLVDLIFVECPTKKIIECFGESHRGWREYDGDVAAPSQYWEFKASDGLYIQLVTEEGVEGCYVNINTFDIDKIIPYIECLSGDIWRQDKEAPDHFNKRLKLGY